LDLQVLVAQLQFHEQLVVRLVRLQLVQVVRVVRLQLVQAQLVLVVQQVLLQLVQAQLLVVAPLELVEHLCLQKKIGVQKKLAQKNLRHPENLAYLF
jgi:hypothetical protein